MTKYQTTYTKRDGGLFHDCIYAESPERAKAMLFSIVDTNPVTMGVMFLDGKTVCTVTK